MPEKVQITYLLEKKSREDRQISKNHRNFKIKTQISSQNRCWHIKSRKESTILMRYLSIRFISCRPSPFRKRSRLELSIRQEQRESNRFSIISCSSAVLGLCRLNTWTTNKAKLPNYPKRLGCVVAEHTWRVCIKSSSTWQMSDSDHTGHCCIFSVAATLCSPDCAPTNVQQPGAGFKG